MTLRKKILVGFGFDLALLSLVLAGAVGNLVGLGRATSAILRENYASIRAAQVMEQSLAAQELGALQAITGPGDPGRSRMRAGETAFLQALGRARDNVTIEGEQAVVDSIASAYDRFLSLTGAPFPTGDAGYFEAGVAPRARAVLAPVRSLLELNQATMYSASDRARRTASRAILSTIAIGLAAVLTGLAFSFWISLRLVRPLRRAIAAAEAIGEGDYGVSLPIDAGDETGQLAREFNAMAGKLRAYRDLNVEQLVAEQRKGQAVLRAIDDVLVVVDPTHRILELNPRAAAVLGTSVTEARGRHLLELLRNEMVFERVKATLAGEAAPSPDEGPEDRILTVGDGEAARDYLFAVTPVRAEGGTLLGAVLLLRDVTRLREVERMKSRFVTAASHELRTPLTSLGMSVDLLRERAAGRSEEEKQLLDAAHEELERLKSLVSDLLELSRLEGGNIDLALEAFPVSLLVEKVLGIFHTQAEAKGVRLTAASGDPLPPVRADLTKIGWVLSNLVSNALRYVDAGGRITLRAHRSGDRVVMSVEDDGPGIPLEYQSRVFEKFAQVEGDPRPGGSGLGLAVCREIVRAHGGVIWLDSEPGRGSVFSFTLPAAGGGGEETKP